MQTSFIDKYKQTTEGQEAESILRNCVHCGFCTATCPTYQLLGDELDGPRGRIYLVKQLLEGQQVTQKTQLHLDRCLTCRSCETTCPSGVRYGRLLDIGRHIVEHEVERSFWDSFMRTLLLKLIPRPKRFAVLLKLGNATKTLLPTKLKTKLPVLKEPKAWPKTTRERKMLVLEGCVQSVVTPNVNAAAAAVLDQLGIQLIREDNAGCCGAVSHHLSAHDETLDYIRRNIDAWWPHIEQGAEAIVMTASGCGVMVKDYATLLSHDEEYAEKARKISSLGKDVSEILEKEDLSVFKSSGQGRKVAFHSPCTLQHGQQLSGVVEKILSRVGYTLTPVIDSHLCCGSAGTYSILQSQLSQQLLGNKLDALQADSPDLIATANIGCQMQLETKAQVPVKHWIELLNRTI